MKKVENYIGIERVSDGLKSDQIISGTSLLYAYKNRAQQLINLEIPVLVRSLKSSSLEFGLCLDGRLFKC